jgi:Na+/proline symporter
MALCGIVGLIVFPFFLLIRFSVYLNLTHSMPAWPALIGGIIATICLLLAYLFLLSFKMANKKRLMKIGLIGISTVVLGYCLFSVFYLSSVHAKSAEVQDVYRSMHPIMRVAVSTVTLADNDLVITDIERMEDDYNRMGLPVNQSSLHYRQESGYVQAVDIRTFDRGFVRNALLRGSLELMGFSTIRHVGTADHLHVELRPLN